MHEIRHATACINRAKIDKNNTPSAKHNRAKIKKVPSIKRNLFSRWCLMTSSFYRTSLMNDIYNFINSSKQKYWF